ncbi:MAG TPA: type II secretion system protein N [Candidatus Binatia bacterium]|nr:type II secretion system protein N [Candidatus Binatia bacterium]
MRVTVALALALLFTVGPVGALEPGGSRLVLLGVVLREPGDSFAIIEDAHTSRVGFYRVGASVGGVRVTRIEADRVVVAAGGTRAVLRLGRAVGVAPEPEPLVPVPVGRPAGDGPAVRPAGATLAAPPPPLYGHPVVVGQSPAPGRREPPISTGTGAAGEAGSTAATAPTGVAADVTFTGLHHNGSRRPGTEFSSAALRDLLIGVTLQRLSGSRQQRIELYAPDGSLYQRLSGPAAATTETRLPVGGTWITVHGLLGTWTVKVFVDGQAAPAGLGTFRLTP